VRRLLESDKNVAYRRRIDGKSPLPRNGPREKPFKLDRLHCAKYTFFLKSVLARRVFGTVHERMELAAEACVPRSVCWEPGEVAPFLRRLCLEEPNRGSPEGRITSLGFEGRHDIFAD